MSVVLLQRFVDIECDVCADTLDVTACHICTLRLCARCWVMHQFERHMQRESSTCDAVFYVAECLAHERNADAPSADDFAAARSDLADYVRTGRAH